MRKIKKFNRIIIKRFKCMLFLTVFFVFQSCSYISASASAGSADLNMSMSGSGSITIDLKDTDGNTVSDGEFTLYYAAVLFLDGGNMAYSYTEEFSGCDADLNSEYTSLAGELAEYAEDNKISGTACSVSSGGSVSFDGLELGLYLIVQTKASTGYYTVSPFVVTVPSDEDGVWVYDVNASPKVEIQAQTGSPSESGGGGSGGGGGKPVYPSKSESSVENSDESEEDDDTDDTVKPDNPEPETVTETETETEPESEPETETEVPEIQTLPQTGQLNWPVPIMAVSGILFFALGKALTKGERQ